MTRIDWDSPQPQRLHLVPSLEHEQDIADAEAWLRDADAYQRLREALAAIPEPTRWQRVRFALGDAWWRLTRPY